VSERALVTGASRGLGRAISEALAADGVEVHGAGRDRAMLDETRRRCSEARGAFVPHVLDVTAEDEVRALFGELPPITVCVNNAGVAAKGSVLQPQTSELRRHFEVNVVAALRIMRYSFDSMRQGGGGRLITVASDAAYRAIPDMGAYVASKHALSGAAATFAAEAAGTNVYFTTVFPGPINTDILGKEVITGGMDAADVAEVVRSLVALRRASASVSEIHLQPKVTAT
jgi:short-subunit dehydrogenase